MHADCKSRQQGKGLAGDGTRPAVLLHINVLQRDRFLFPSQTCLFFLLMSSFPPTLPVQHTPLSPSPQKHNRVTSLVLGRAPHAVGWPL